METFNTLLGILFIVGALVYRLVKKAQETAARESRERPARPATAEGELALPTATFQELLRQMQARNQGETATATPAPPARPQGSRTPAGRTVPPAHSQERTSYRSTSLEAPATARNMNAAPPAARRADTLPRATVTAAADPLFAAQYQATPPAEPVNQAVRRLLSQPASVRAAFVLGEILQRRG